MMYELVIIFEYPRERKIYEYSSEEDALDAEKGMKIALGNQIAWSCVRPKLH